MLYSSQEILDVPNELTEALAKAYLPKIFVFYENEENMQEYVAWKLEQDKKAEQIA